MKHIRGFDNQDIFNYLTYFISPLYIHPNTSLIILIKIFF